MGEQKRRRPTNKKTSPEAIENNERDAEALSLRAKGWTYDQIADHLGFAARGNAYRAIQRRLQETLKEPAEELRQVEAERLRRGYEEVFRILDDVVDLSTLPEDLSSNQLLERVEAMLAADREMKLKAVDRLTRLSDRHSKLFGLDAPAKTEVSGPGGFIVAVNPDLLPDGVNLDGGDT